ncbi:unnamed protein product [Allacma fusca]|uniref:Uncharacterized protein n=1 Tax=Allacma fusca TaxID=39272 RepID=A0A8J2J5T8_9HEXA|nr:unnamed protein product [Allacma fusca]
MARERLICCCGSSAWTKVIGWLQIVGCAFAVALITLMLLGVNLTFSGDKLARLENVSTYLLIYFVLSAIMGIVLIQGSLTRNARQLMVWRDYTATCLLFGSIWYINFIAGTFSSSLIFLVPSLVVSGFCLWVVGVHQGEIEDSKLQMLPINKRPELLHHLTPLSKTDSILKATVERERLIFKIGKNFGRMQKSRIFLNP